MKRRARNLINRIDSSINSRYEFDCLDASDVELVVMHFPEHYFKKWGVSYSLRLKGGEEIIKTRFFKPVAYFFTYFGASRIARGVRTYYREKGLSTQVTEVAA